MANICYRPSHSCSECHHFRYNKLEGREECYLGVEGEVLEWIDLDPREQKYLKSLKIRRLKSKHYERVDGKLIVSTQ